MNINNVAFIGLGKMGTVLARKLLEANFNLTVYNRTPSKMQPLINEGAKGANSVEEAVFGADVVITCLLNDESVLNTVTSTGFITAMKPGAVHIGTSTILPSTAKIVSETHAKNNTAYVGGNVLGVPKAAAKGELTSLVAGNSDIVEACTPIFKAYSSKIIHVGENPWEANVMKVCMNYLLATAIEAMGEIYTFAEKSELDKGLIEKMLHSVFAHPAFRLYVDKISMRNFDDVNFTLSGGLKDLNLFQQAFKEAGVSPDIANIIQEKFTRALAAKMGEKDWSAVTEVTRRDAGLSAAY